MHDFRHCPVQGEVAELRDEVRILKEQIAHLASGASGSSARDKGKGKATSERCRTYQITNLPRQTRSYSIR
ncbi:hypothetical protein LINPERHAP1_LOCUS8244, partial [Linum perenne]